MITTLLLIVFAACAVTAGLSSLLARDQIDEDRLREEVSVTALLAKDPRGFPDRIFTSRGVRLKRISLVATALAFVSIVAYIFIQ